MKTTKTIDFITLLLEIASSMRDIMLIKVAAFVFNKNVSFKKNFYNILP